MSRRVLVTLAAVLIGIAAASPARALSGAAQTLNDIYALTKDGKVYRLVGGGGSPVLELDLGPPGDPFDAEWVDFDPASFQFVVGPGIDGTGDSYVRLSSLLTSPVPIPGTTIIGGHGGAVDRFRAPTSGKSDLLVADPTPGIVGVVRIKGDNSISTALSVAPQGYSVPEDVEMNYANGDIFVSVQATASLPGAILRYNNSGGFIERIDMAGGSDPFCLVYDNTDAVPNYDMVAAGFNGTKQIFLVDVDNDRPAGEPRLKLLGNAPAPGAACDDLSISHQGKLMYPDAVGGVLYSVELTGPSAGAATPLATIAQVKSVTFVSRNYLAPQDTGLTVGQFVRTTGPNGRTAVQVTVTDPEFSSGIIHVLATGSNLAVNGVPLPFEVWLDARRELTKFQFLAEKINNSLSASIRVEAHDAAGLCGDPPLALMASTKGKGTAETLDLTGLDKANKRSVVIENAGIDKMDLEIAGKQYKLNGDAKTPSGTTIDATAKNGTIKIALNGKTTLLVPTGASLRITVQGNGKNVGNEAAVEVY